MTIKYYLGQLANSEQISSQAKGIRRIILSSKHDEDVLKEILNFMKNEPFLQPDTAKVINTALLCSYGSEYLGIGGDDNDLKAEFYLRLIEKYPDECSFRIKYAECAQMAGQDIENFYPNLKHGLMADVTHQYYPSSELIELIHESPYSFEFDLLLLENYYQPCDKQTFNEYVNEFTDKYQLPEQQRQLSKVKWKGMQ